MHLKRWLTSLVLILVLVLILFRGGAHFFPLFIMVVCLLSMREYYRMVWPEKKHPLMRSISLTGYVMGPLLVLSSHLFPFSLFVFFCSISLIVPGWICLRHFKSDAGIPSMLSLHTLGMVYIPLVMVAYTLIYHADRGAHWIFMILCVVSAGDIGAYYIGSLWGRHKLCPAVSPGKTVEGAIGGLVCNLVIGFMVAFFLLPAVSTMKVALFSIVLGAAGQTGDLFESVLKRSAGMKDSGSLLPGHGGLLDRIDSLLFAGPMALVMILHLF